MKFYLLLVILITIVVIGNVEGMPGGKAGLTEAAIAALKDLIDKAFSILDDVTEYKFSNKAMFCLWNDWQGRDGMAHMYKAYNECRFHYEKRALGFVDGNWYCTMTQDACVALGHNLDETED